MKFKWTVFIVLGLFTVYCGFLIQQSGLGNDSSGSDKLIQLAADTPEDQPAETESSPEELAEESIFDLSGLTAIPSKAGQQAITMGSVDPQTGYWYEVVLSNKGAGVAEVTMSGFKDRDPDDPKPLKLISPAKLEGSQLKKYSSYSFANNFFKVGTQQIPLNLLTWETEGLRTNAVDDSQSVEFTAVVKDKNGRDAFRITKAYSLNKESYDLGCKFRVENITDLAVKPEIGIQGPIGICREGFRSDQRNIVAAYQKEGSLESAVLESVKLRKAIQKGDKKGARLGIKGKDAKLLWSSVTNKYFAAIVRPVAENGRDYVEDISIGNGLYFDSKIAEKKPAEDATFTYNMLIAPESLAQAGLAKSTAEYDLSIYIGPKDKSIFDKNPDYDKYGYFHTISFRSCCCFPQSIITPLAFGITGLMKMLYNAMGPWGNYGVVIMILVVLVRILLHPLSKKGQMSMMKMQKINKNPKMAEIKKKYAGDPREMQRQQWALMKEMGISPASQFTSILPMFIQMPIWIALWTAVYSNVDLRGAGFLPVWITDLSAPDRLFLIPYAEKMQQIPFIGALVPEYFNLLPILMGIVMYMQQKLMPSSQAAANMDPQQAQMQKMMLIMMPLMFPILLYNGPSGVNMYIMSSMAAGVWEQKVIRKHIKEKEQEEEKGLVSATAKTGGKVKKKKAKPIFRNYK